MKTIKEWFESVENPILRKVLLMRLDEYNKNYKEKVNSFIQATIKGFYISQTKEGGKFWYKVFVELKKYNKSSTFNAKYPVMQVEWLDENECIHCETEEECGKLYELLGEKWDCGSLKGLCFFVKLKSWTFYSMLNRIYQYEEKPTIYPAKLFMKKDLLEQAKLRFPIGTKFKSPEDNIVYTATGKYYKSCNYSSPNEPNYKSILVEVNNTNKGSYLFFNQQWANYVEVYEFKVGDVLETDIVREWCLNGDNLLSVNWTKYHIGYSWKEPFKIDKITYLDNNIAFKLSGMNWIKAEGLREFIELEKQKTFDKIVSHYSKLGVDILSDLKTQELKFDLANQKLKQDVKEAEKQFIECCNDLKQTNMKQTLTLGQLKELYHADNCPDWRKRLIEYITFNSVRKDEFPIIIEQKDLDYAKQNASKEQLKLLTDAGLVFEEKFKIGDWVFWSDGNIKIVNTIKDKCKSFNNSWKLTDKYDSCNENYLRLATQEEIDYASIDWDKLKTGSLVRLKDGIEGLDNKQCRIVFYDLPYKISKTKQFENFAGNSTQSYVTVYQYDKYVSICTEYFKQWLKKVISY